MQLSIESFSLSSIKTIEKPVFTSRLIDWYQANKRDLPWRKTHDPYRIWLSEVILQQTRVAQGLPYYQRFVERYPSVNDLAAAKEQEVLRLWQGLGYYSRARNLHACAQMIVSEFGGKFPDNYKDLLCLKGVGKYTAAAIASIAFKEPVPVVDGNVYRVLARVFGIEENMASTQGEKVFYKLANTLVPKEKADLYNQAIMEFGAIHCMPANPKCGTCIFKAQCVALHSSRQRTLPIKVKNLKVRQRFFHYFIIQFKDKLYMKKREESDIWRGLYDFYLIEGDQFKPPHQLESELLSAIQRYKLVIKKRPTLYKHILTHQRLNVCFFHIKASTPFINESKEVFNKMNITPFTLEEIKTLPKPILINNFLKNELYSVNCQPNLFSNH
ncbi:MAG: A/G-specific adenine glycosylase [Cytophagales bacterium]|nr:A/G-specific adenine glycosylase [Cytophagales bacterium]